MKNLKVKKITAFALAILLTLSVLMLCLQFLNTDRLGKVRAEGLYDKYVYGANFTIPDLVDENNQVVESEKILYYPDGRGYSKSAYVLDIPGEYTVEYRIKQNGAVVRTIEEKFDVYENVYSFSDNVSTAEYVEDASTLAHPDLGAGLKVSLYAKSFITFNEVVDMNALNGASPISFYVTPKKVGARDFQRLVVRLTDAEDASNYVTFYAHQTSSETYTSMQAGAAHQPMSGRLKWGGEWPKDELQVGGTKGQLADFSLNGKHTSNSFRLYNLQLNLDTFEVYIQSKKIIDLNDPNDFEVPWKGFTNNKVYVSVGAEMVDNTTADMVITNVFGVDLSAEHVSNTDAPEITVDFSGYQESKLPVAVVDKPYQIFAAKGDATTNRHGVVAKVYYNYGDEAFRKDVLVKDGVFTPKMVGKYTIEYTATDIYGMTTIKCVDVSCVKSVPAISINVDLSEISSTATVGEKVFVNTEFDVNGGSGNLKKEVIVTLNGQEIEVVDGYFLPLSEGVYKVVYKATDYITNEKTKSCEIQASFSDKPIFVNEPVLYDYFVSGSEYKLAPYFAYDYKTNKNVEATCVIKVGDNTIPVTNGKFTLTTEKSVENATFVYTANSATKEVVKTVHSVKDGNGINILNYFATTGGVAVQELDDAILLNATENGCATYINPLLLQGLTYRFEGVKEKSNFTAINVILADPLNKQEKVTFKVARGGVQGTTVTINGQDYSLSNSFDANAVFNISYSNDFIDFCAQAKDKIDAFDNGEVFSGFSSGYAYLTIEFVGVTGESAVKVTRIWGQNVSVSNFKTNGDERKPVADFTADLGGTFKIGEEITVPTCLPFDLFDPNPKATIIVTNPDEEVATTVDGIELSGVKPDKEFKIKLDKEGVYTVLVTVTDAAGLKGRVSREIKVVKDSEPTIVLGKYSTKYNVGDMIKVASAKALGVDGKELVDAEGNKLPIFIFVFDSEGKMNQLKGTDEFNSSYGTETFKAEYTGTYRVCYLVKDGDGNVSYAEYEVTVK